MTSFITSRSDLDFLTFILEERFHLLADSHKTI